MKFIIPAAFKFAIKPLLKAVLKASIKASLIAMVLFGMAAVDILPRSPFRAINIILIAETQRASEILRYLPVFIPIYEMLTALTLWVGAIIVWYFVKWALRIGKIIS